MELYSKSYTFYFYTLWTQSFMVFTAISHQFSRLSSGRWQNIVKRRHITHERIPIRHKCGWNLNWFYVVSQVLFLLAIPLPTWSVLELVKTQSWHKNGGSSHFPFLFFECNASLYQEPAAPSSRRKKNCEKWFIHNCTKPFCRVLCACSFEVRD